MLNGRIENWKVLDDEASCCLTFSDFLSSDMITNGEKQEISETEPSARARSRLKTSSMNFSFYQFSSFPSAMVSFWFPVCVQNSYRQQKYWEKIV